MNAPIPRCEVCGHRLAPAWHGGDAGEDGWHMECVFGCDCCIDPRLTGDTQ